MKIHRHIVEEIVMALGEIFSTGRPADKVLEKVLKSQRKWGARDRKFFAESCYEIVRHWRRLWVSAGLPPENYLDGEALQRWDVFQVWARYEFERSNDLPKWPEFEKLQFGKINLSKWPRAVRESIPDWLDEMGEREFGKDWDLILPALNRPAEVFLRVNTLKTDVATAIARLAEDEVGAEAVPNTPETLRLPVRKNVFITKAFKEGLFEVQDAASQTVARLLAPEPGQRVYDACAGAGGKTLHLAALMKNKGRILAFDIHDWKLKELRTRASRAGVDVVETRLIEGTKTIKKLESTADRVLLDVPCSGLGVLRRNPDTKWKLRPEEIERLHTLQSEILSSYSRMTKPGGVLVYATCSILPSENREQVQAFLQSEAGASWKLEKEQVHRPDREGFDGFYAARLQRVTE